MLRLAMGYANRKFLMIIVSWRRNLRLALGYAIIIGLLFHMDIIHRLAIGHATLFFMIVVP